MPRTKQVQRAANRLLRMADLAVVRTSTLATVEAATGISHQDGWAVPDEATRYLTPANPRLQELNDAYRGHPATVPTAWNADHVSERVDLVHFRGDTEFVYQKRGHTHPAQYAWTAEYVAAHDRLGLLDRLSEDGAFGAFTFDVGGRTISRDLLDSVLEINALHDHFDLGDAPVVLDVGAGYGRLAERMCVAFPDAVYLCTDAIAVSTFISEFYLRWRRLPNARVVPLTEVADLLTTTRVDLVVAVHSWPECPLSSIAWWAGTVGSSGARSLFIAADETELTSSEGDGRRLPFLPLFEQQGFQVLDHTTKYVGSPALQEYGLYPDQHFFLTR